jgi:hypothetical protein
MVRTDCLTFSTIEILKPISCTAHVKHSFSRISSTDLTIAFLTIVSADFYYEKGYSTCNSIDTWESAGV